MDSVLPLSAPRQKQLETSMADTHFIGTVWVRDIKLPVFASAPSLHSWMHQVVALDKTHQI